MEHLQEYDVEANENFDNLLGRKAKRRRARRKADRRRGRRIRKMMRRNPYATASVSTQVRDASIGGNPLMTGGQYIGGGGSSATLNTQGALGGVIGKLFKRRKRRNRKHKKLLRAINNPSWLSNPRNHYKLKDAVRQMAIQSNNDGKTAEEMVKFSSKPSPRPFPEGQSWMYRKPSLIGSRHYGFDGYNADGKASGSATQKSFLQKYGLILGVVAVGGFLFFTPQGKKLIGRG